MPFPCVNSSFSALVFWLSRTFSPFSYSDKVPEIFFWFVQAYIAKFCVDLSFLVDADHVVVLSHGEEDSNWICSILLGDLVWRSHKYGAALRVCLRSVIRNRRINLSVIFSSKGSHMSTSLSHVSLRLCLLWIFCCNILIMLCSIETYAVAFSVVLDFGEDNPHGVCLLRYNFESDFTEK